VTYSISSKAAKPTIAALPFNCSANRLNPNLVTTSLGWTDGCTCAMILKKIAFCKVSLYLFYGCLAQFDRDDAGSRSTDSGLHPVGCEEQNSTIPAFDRRSRHVNWFTLIDAVGFSFALLDALHLEETSRARIRYLSYTKI
jgi:hypothetical protein